MIHSTQITNKINNTINHTSNRPKKTKLQPQPAQAITTHGNSHHPIPTNSRQPRNTANRSDSPACLSWLWLSRGVVETIDLSMMNQFNQITNQINHTTNHTSPGARQPQPNKKKKPHLNLQQPQTTTDQSISIKQTWHLLCWWARIILICADGLELETVPMFLNMVRWRMEEGMTQTKECFLCLF